jgi:hypothetical protein
VGGRLKARKFGGRDVYDDESIYDGTYSAIAV